MLLFSGCEEHKGKPFYTICSDGGGCEDTYDYTLNGSCVVFSPVCGSIVKAKQSTCGSYRIYSKQGAVAKTPMQTQTTNSPIMH